MTEERKFTDQEKYLLEMREAARILQSKEGEKLVEFFKITGNFYFPHPTGKTEKCEGFRAAACLLDHLVRGRELTPEAFLSNMEVFNAMWKS